MQTPKPKTQPDSSHRSSERTFRNDTHLSRVLSTLVVGQWRRRCTIASWNIPRDGSARRLQFRTLPAEHRVPRTLASVRTKSHSCLLDELSPCSVATAAQSSRRLLGTALCDVVTARRSYALLMFHGRFPLPIRSKTRCARLLSVPEGQQRSRTGRRRLPWQAAPFSLQTRPLPHKALNAPLAPKPLLLVIECSRCRAG